MFRKGGNVGDGIMTGIVDRTNHAEDPFVGGTDQYSFNTPYQGRTIPSLKDLTAESTETLLEAAGDRGGFDPLTSFLLAYGPSAAVEDRGGGTISNLIAAAEKPVQALIKEKADEAKFQRGIRTKAAGAAIGQRNEMIAAESDRKFKFDLAKAQERLQRDLTTQEIEAIRLRAEQKVKTDTDLAIKKSELDTDRAIEVLKQKEMLERASPEEKVEAFSLQYAKDDYGGNQIKGRNRAEYEFVIGPKIEKDFGVKKNGGFIDIDTTNLEKTNKLMKKKIKSGGLNKFFTNIQDGITYILTEQGLQQVDINDPAAQNVPTTDTTGKVETGKSLKEKMENNPNSIFRKDGLFLTEEELKARNRGSINQGISGIGEI